MSYILTCIFLMSACVCSRVLSHTPSILASQARSLAASQQCTNTHNDTFLLSHRTSSGLSLRGNHVGGGGVMGGSAAQFSAGGLDSSGLNKAYLRARDCLNKACLRARDFCDVAQATEVLSRLRSLAKQ